MVAGSNLPPLSIVRLANVGEEVGEAIRGKAVNGNNPFRGQRVYPIDWSSSRVLQAPTFHKDTRWTLLLCTSGSVPIYALLG